MTKPITYKTTEFDHFAHIVSHDLKSPLRNIGSYAQLLKRRYHESLDADANIFLDYIVQNALLMNDFLTDILELSTIAHDFPRVATDFNQLCQKVERDLQLSVALHKAIIHIDKLPILNVYPASIEQLLFHLVDNSLKFRNGKTPYIHVSAVLIADKNIWHFSVKDNGVGLDEKYHDKVFLPFQRIDFRDRPGSGIGLAICRKVVQLHGGNIWYTQNTEGGTTFHFTLPV